MLAIRGDAEIQVITVHPMTRHHADDLGPYSPRAGHRSDVPRQRETRDSRAELVWRTPTPRVLVIHTSGELDPVAGESLSKLVDEQLGLSRLCRVVLDLTDVAVLSADGVRLLLDLHRRSRVEGFALVLVGSARREVERPLRLAGALPLFTTRTTVRHALAGLPP